MLVTFEGIEGCGKSTQAILLRDYLQSRDRRVVLTREPGGTRLGLELRKILLSIQNQDLSQEAELFLYLADRAQHVQSLVRPSLESGMMVICDRYADSTIVYQGYARGIDPGVLAQLNSMATRGLVPTLTILLDMPAEKGLERALRRNTRSDPCGSEGRFEAESLAFHRKVRQGYLELAAQNRDRFFVVDALMNAPSIHGIIVRKIEDISEKT